MNTYYATYLLTCSIAVILLTGCDATGSSEPMSEAVTISFETAQPTYPHATGRFVIDGAVSDRGSFEEHMVVSSEDDKLKTIYGWRVLTGARGTARIQYAGYAVPSADKLRGESSVVEGTGDYAVLVGSRGDFELKLSVRGSPETSSMTIRR